MPLCHRRQHSLASLCAAHSTHPPHPTPPLTRPTRYNLKRKIAGLPPVTREWYESRKSQLLAASSAAAVQRVWFDPLTRKKFYSENTYLAYTRSKKYADLVRKTGAPAPTAVVTLRQVAGPAEDAAAAAAAAPSSAPAPRPAKAGFTAKLATKVAGGVREVEQAADTTLLSEDGYAVAKPETGSEGAEEGEGSDWETASEEEMESDQQVGGVGGLGVGGRGLKGVPRGPGRTAADLTRLAAGGF